MVHCGEVDGCPQGLKAGLEHAAGELKALVGDDFSWNTEARDPGAQEGVKDSGGLDVDERNSFQPASASVTAGEQVLESVGEGEDLPG